MCDISETRKSPCCNAEAWDVDCDMCEGSGDDSGLDTECPQCQGQGYIDGYLECSECGDIYDDDQ